MPRSLRVGVEYIQKVKLALRRNGFARQIDLAEDLELSLSTVSHIINGRTIDYVNFLEICRKLGLDWEEIADFGNRGAIPSVSSPIANTRQDWGETVDVSAFSGRKEEQDTLEQWIITERCRLVALLGMGGIGKTSLSVKLAHQIKNEFEYVIWRSLRNAPPVEEMLADLSQFLSNKQETKADLPENVGGRVSRLIHYLREHRCLLVLDNAETILRSGDRAGYYREGYEDYGELLRRVGEELHQSCLLLTSREKPKETASLEGKNLPVRSLQLRGLNAEEGQVIFQAKGLSGSEEEWGKLIERYAGNPLALEIVSTTIQDIFNGNITNFLEEINQGSASFGDISELLKQQEERLSDLEKEIIYWLAINREPVSLSELRSDIVSPVGQTKLLEALESLERRSLLDKLSEKNLAIFALHPVVMEYLIEQLIEQVCEDIIFGKITINKTSLFRSHALIKAQVKDYVRVNQIRLILEPVINRLLTFSGSEKIWESI